MDKNAVRKQRRDRKIELVKCKFILRLHSFETNAHQLLKGWFTPAMDSESDIVVAKTLSTCENRKSESSFESEPRQSQSRIWNVFDFFPYSAYDPVVYDPEKAILSESQC